MNTVREVIAGAFIAIARRIMPGNCSVIYVDIGETDPMRGRVLFAICRELNEIKKLRGEQ